MAQLNSKIFTPSGEMRPEVRERLLEIADEFLDGINDDLDFKVYDIRLVGSNAAYNYTKNSDIDLHIVVDLAEICKCNPEIVQYLFNAEKAKFNMSYDIKLRGADVEIYVEDIRAGTISNGIYSVLEDEWVKVPEDNSDLWSDFDPEYSDLYEEWYRKIISVLEDDTSDSDEVSDMIDDLYILRKSSLENDGEYGEGNLVFKALRNEGLLDALRNKYHEGRSDELTLENYK